MHQRSHPDVFRLTTSDNAFLSHQTRLTAANDQHQLVWLVWVLNVAQHREHRHLFRGLPISLYPEFPIIINLLHNTKPVSFV
jgi:hypothetical protein